MDYNHEDQGETFDKATGAPVGHKPPKPIVIKTDDGVVELVLVDDGADNSSSPSASVAAADLWSR
jgi:hypothetical protein